MCHLNFQSVSFITPVTAIVTYSLLYSSQKYRIKVIVQRAESRVLTLNCDSSHRGREKVTQLTFFRVDKNMFSIFTDVLLNRPNPVLLPSVSLMFLTKEPFFRLFLRST